MSQEKLNWTAVGLLITLLISGITAWVSINSRVASLEARDALRAESIRALQQDIDKMSNKLDVLIEKIGKLEK